MGALLCYSVVQSLGLLVSAVITTREACRLTEWPGLPTKAFLSCSAVLDLLSVVATRQSNTTAVLVQSILSLVLALALVAFCHYKDELRTTEEREQLELDRVSVDIFDGHPMFRLSTAGSHYDPLFDGSQASSASSGRHGYWNSSGFFQLLPASEGGVGAGVTGVVSWFASFLVSDPSRLASKRQERRNRQGRDKELAAGGGALHSPLLFPGDDDEDHDLDFDDSEAGSGGTGVWVSVSGKSSTIAGGGEEEGYRRASSLDSAFHALRSLLPSSAGGGGGSPRSLSAADDGVPVVQSALEARLGSGQQQGQGQATATMNPSSPGGAGGGGDAGMTLALQRALGAQRARISSSSPLKAPSSSLSLGGGSRATRSRNSSEDTPSSSSAARTGSADRAASGQGEGREKAYSVTVERWGLRRDRVRCGEGAAGAGAAGAQSEIATDSSSSSSSSSEEADVAIEIEFELHVRAGEAPKHDWAGGGGGGGSATGSRTHWVVWRSAAEVLQLHASLAAAYGDLAPRRPRLRSAKSTDSSSPSSSSSASCSPGDVAADMRAVGIYLMALLRARVHQEFPAVLSFLEIWDHDSSASSVSYLSSAGGGGLDALTPENWRRLFVSLRVRCKPREVGVRCRLFEGVVSGAEVADWLVSSGYSAEDARAIGQRLVGSGLLVAACSGYASAPAHEGDNKDMDKDNDRDRALIAAAEAGGGEGEDGYQSPSEAGLQQQQQQQPSDEKAGSVSSRGSLNSSSMSSAQWTALLSAASSGAGGDSGPVSAATGAANSRFVFSALPGWLYTYQQKSSTSFAVGKFVLFGTTISALIPQWQRAAEGGADQPGGGVVEYQVICRHGGDEWTLFRRYSEFADLHRCLLQRGIKPSAPLPPKSGIKGIGRQHSPEELEARRAALELYLTSVLASVVATMNPEGHDVLARFLDSDFTSLVLH